MLFMRLGGLYFIMAKQFATKWDQRGVVTEETYHRSGGGSVLLLFLSLVVAVMLFMIMAGGLPQVMATTDHAVERHGYDVLEIDRVCRSGGMQETWWNPNTSRTAFVCKIDEKWGIAIYEEGKLVTAFFKDKMRTLQQVWKYLQNAGYVK
jgi:hypothetical protein